MIDPLSIFTSTIPGTNIQIISMIEFIVVLVVGVIIAKIARLYIRRILKDKIPGETLIAVEKLFYYGIITIAFIVALPYIGISLGGLLMAGGLLGIVLGFASQTVVANLISGMFLLGEKPMKIGDEIGVEGVDGVVEDIRVISTTIRTYDGIKVRIPNEKVFNARIKNYSEHPVRRFEYVVGIRYADDAERAIEIIKQIAEEHPLILKEPSPLIFVEELADSSVNIRVKLWAPSAAWYGVKMELLWKIKVELEKAGIEIPFPQIVVWEGKKKDENN